MGESISLNKVTQIIELTKGGMFKSEIARKLGVSKSTIYKYQQRFSLI